MKTFIEFLTKYVSFQTLSQEGHQQPDQIRDCLQFLTRTLTDSGFRTELWETATLNPVLFAEHITDPSFETVLVYGHYDVVSVHKPDWDNDPFTLTQKDGRVIARGIVDNKGQNAVHLWTICQLIKEGTLGYNVKFFIEGNEETGSVGIEEIVHANKAKLQCHHILVSDGSVVGRNPIIETSLRGLVNLKVRLETADSDQHSGMAGGLIPNATTEASKLIASLYASTGRVLVPGFYDDMPMISGAVRTNNQELSKLTDWKKLFGVRAIQSVAPVDPVTQIGLMPSLEVMGFTSGQAHQGYRHIVPASAEFGLNMRIVGTQNPTEMAQKVSAYLQKNTPSYVKLGIEVMSKHPAVMLAPNPELMGRAKDTLERIYGNTLYTAPVGGGIPIVETFKNELGIDALLIPLGNEDCNMHGKNENFTEWHIEKALAFSKEFFQK